MTTHSRETSSCREKGDGRITEEGKGPDVWQSSNEGCIVASVGISKRESCSEINLLNSGMGQGKVSVQAENPRNRYAGLTSRNE